MYYDILYIMVWSSVWYIGVCYGLGIVWRGLNEKLPLRIALMFWHITYYGMF